VTQSDDIAISVQDLNKTFKLPHEKNSSIKGALINLRKHKKGYEKQHVLKNISFDIKKGEFFGIVGRNGSGKSTLLKLLAGIYAPDSGVIQVNGKLTPFIELGVGFNPELTGRENVFLNGALLGFNRKEMLALYDDIVEFAELERFMDQKLKNYSSGMQVRLAFSIAIRAQSDILVLDEVLAVGDAAFQMKCFDYFYELKERKATVVLVSHDRTSLERFCDRGILIDQGEIVESGSMQEIMQRYDTVVIGQLDGGHEKQKSTENVRHASQAYAAIHSIRLSADGRSPKLNFKFGQNVSVSFDVQVLRDIQNPILGVTIREKHSDKPIFAYNTLLDNQKKTGTFAKGEKLHFEVALPAGLNDGEYTVEPAICNETATIFYDTKPDGAKFVIIGSKNPYSIMSSIGGIHLTKGKDND
jgi:ABC-2 type transport system ATP-binding protein